MKDWKACERRVAELLGGRRIPVSGRTRGDCPDVAHPTLSIECKSRKKLPAWIEDAMKQAEASAKDGRLPVAVRLRRDFGALLNLIRAHAVLHQADRERDEKGQIVATIEDYAVVRRVSRKPTREEELGRFREDGSSGGGTRRLYKPQDRREPGGEGA